MMRKKEERKKKTSLSSSDCRRRRHRRANHVANTRVHERHCAIRWAAVSYVCVWHMVARMGAQRAERDGENVVWTYRTVDLHIFGGKGGRRKRRRE